MVAISPFRERLVVFALPVTVDPVTFHLLWHRRTNDHPAQRWLRDEIATAVPVQRN
jgi:DNA-binding transcriptional LysR family regulator